MVSVIDLIHRFKIYTMMTLEQQVFSISPRPFSLCKCYVLWSKINNNTVYSLNCPLINCVCIRIVFNFTVLFKQIITPGSMYEFVAWQISDFQPLFSWLVCLFQLICLLSTIFIVVSKRIFVCIHAISSTARISVLKYFSLL